MSKDYLGKTVAAIWATEQHKPVEEQRLRALGEAIAYSNEPQVLIETEDGECIWWNEDLVRLSEVTDIKEQDMTTMQHGQLGELEVRNCFKQEPHSMHDWHSKYWCTGTGLDKDDKVIVEKTGEDPAPEKEDRVNHPSHYNSHPSGIELIEVARHFNFNIGNAIKYVWRAGLKAEADVNVLDKHIEDLEKAQWYLNDEITQLKAKRDAITTTQATPLPDQSEGRMIESWAKRTGNPYANVSDD